MFLCQLASDRADHLLGVDAAQVFTFQLGDDDEPFFSIVVHRERRHVAWPHRVVGARRSRFQILRIVITAAQDDQILDAADDEQFILDLHAQVARAQIAPRVTGQRVAEGRLRQLGQVPVARRDTGAAEPDFANPARLRLQAGVRIDHAQRMRRMGRTAADQLRAGRVAVGQPPHAQLAQRLAFDSDHARRRIDRRSADGQRGFGHAVAGEEGLGPEAADGKARVETRQRVGAHRFGRVVGHAPAAQVQLREVGIGDFVDAQVEGEVGRAAACAPIQADGAQPLHRLAYEAGRCHQHRLRAQHHRHQHAHHQAQVVEGRYPVDEHVIRPGRHHGRQVAGVGNDVGVGDDHALRGTGGTRGVLQEGRIIRCGRGAAVGGIRLRGQVVDGHQFQRQFGAIVRLPGRLHGSQFGRAGERDAGAAAGRDVDDAVGLCVAARWIQRHRHHAGQQAAVEGLDVGQSRREEQHHAAARCGALAQQLCHGAGVLPQLRVRQRLWRQRGVGQEAEGGGVGFGLRVLAQLVDDVGFHGMESCRWGGRVHSARSVMRITIDGPWQ